MFMETSTGDYPLSQADIEQRFPATSFPADFSPPDGYVRVEDVPPIYNQMTQRATQQSPVLVDGVWRQSWVIADLSGDEIAANQALAASNARAAAKVVRQAAVDAIKVTVASGKTFDGNEAAQANLLLAVQVAQITGLTETEWTLADNSRVTVTLAEIKEALTLAALEKSRLWPLPA